MVLVPHMDGYRRIWQFPRNKRRIQPWKLARILLLLSQSRIDGWARNQDAQDEFCKALEESGLKRLGFQRDDKSGGPRTYLAQLKALGLVFERNGVLFPTIAGEDLMHGNKGLEVMQTVLLRHQYPSIYGQGQNVRINPELRVKPILFVLQLLDNEMIGSLTSEELAIPVIYGHNHDCVNICIDKILKLRSGKTLLEVIDSPEADLYLPRSSNTSIETRLNNIRDIANTCMNYMDSCFVVNTDEENRRKKIVFNEEIRPQYQLELGNLEKFIPVQSEEQFQRRYGCWDRLKDTRDITLGSPRLGVPQVAANIIIGEYFQLCGQKLEPKIPEDFIDNLHSDWGFSRQLIVDTITPFVDKALSCYSTTFLELARGGQKTALEFETVVCNLIKERLFFDVEHTGQKRPPNQRKGGYADAFLVASDKKHCGLLDTKASSNYSVSHNDYNAMVHTYIPNYRELAGGRNLQLEFCLYVAYGYGAGIDIDLRNMCVETGTNVSAIKARDLLELAQIVTEPPQQNQVRKGFCKGGLLKLGDFNL